MNKVLPSPPIGGSFELIDQHGRLVSDRTFHGRHVMIFFGFTNCPVVCPRALARLSSVLDELGPVADRIQPLYITVDPERDSPDVLGRFLQPYPRFVGLTGTREQVDRAKRAFRVFAERTNDPRDPSGYAIPHTAITYVMDGDGRFVSHFSDALAADEVAARLRLLIGWRSPAL